MTDKDQTKLSQILTEMYSGKQNKTLSESHDLYEGDEDQFDDEDDDATLFRLGNNKKPRYVWEICGNCRGSGGTSNHLGVINREEFDEDELEDYFNGGYDKTCEDCKGSGKVHVLDRDSLNPEQSRFIDRRDREKADMEAEIESERRMGA